MPENPNSTNVAAPGQRRGRGKPATLTLAMVERIGALVARGLTEEQACVRTGVNYNTFTSGKRRRGEYALAIKSSHAAFLDMATARIAEGKPGWQGLAWILERRHKPQFSRAPDVEVHQTQSVGLTFDAATLADLERLARKQFDGPQPAPAAG